MSTTHPNHSQMEPYEGEYVWAEIVDDEDPGPRRHHNHDREQAQQHGNAAGGAASTRRNIARYAAVAARYVAGQTGPGLRHGWAATVHWTTLGSMSDEEIRRRLVKVHLDVYTAQREDTTADIKRLNKRAQKLAREAVDFGLTPQEAARLKNTHAELKLKARAGTALGRIPFQTELLQPTPDQVRRYRTVRSLGRFAGVIVPTSAAALALVLAAPAAGLVALPVLAGAAWWLGHHPLALTERALPADLVGPPELEPVQPTQPVQHTPGTTPKAAPGEEDLTPFPVRDVTTVDQAEEALRRAILHEDGDIEVVTDGRQEPWGWSARVVFASGSPDDLNKDDTYKNLITLLKLRRNGLLIEADPEHGDTCTVRMIISDPFTPELVGSVPYRAPQSMSIVDMADYGVAMDATPLVFSLAGLMLLMVADSGGGKSGIMLAMGEVATACRDTAVINIDPAGTGIGDLGPAITLDACMDDTKIRAVLEFLLEWCSARARQRAAYGWGNKWRVSRDHPAICVFVDEWAQLSDRAKKLLIRLLLIGRKEAIWVYGGSQYGTKDWLGEAIGPKLSSRLLGACRRVDVTELLGAGALAEGYRADLIRAATHTAVNDAGQIYGQGLPGMPDRAIRYKVREISPDYAHRVATERRDAGLANLTHTLTEAGLLDAWNELTTTCSSAPGPDAGTADEGPEAPPILRILRDAFANENDPEFLTVDRIHTHLKADDPQRWGKWDEREDRLAMVGRTLRRALADEGISIATTRLRNQPGEPTAYRLEDVEAAMNSSS
ncbi:MULTISPECIES: hypothetical protein [unclassified Streptomyces]|uniref:hypothetical protein n=1 Tax=unclassified Streptomyces TaxID=2593676 RepID=UPI002F90CB2A